MIQFDINQIPDAIIKPDTIRVANAVLRQLYKMRVSSIIFPEEDLGFEQASMTRVYLQSHLRRLLMFLQGGVAEYRAVRPLVAISAARHQFAQAGAEQK
jgi:hypothetical protein